MLPRPDVATTNPTPRLPMTLLPDQAGYVPGVCNIGPAEIAQRRRSGHVGMIATGALFALLVAVDAPPAAHLLLAAPATIAAAGYLQAWLRFCAGFGALGVFNLGEVGPTEAVADAGARARDRLRALQIGLASLGIGLAVAVTAFLVA